MAKVRIKRLLDADTEYDLIQGTVYGKGYALIEEAWLKDAYGMFTTYDGKDGDYDTHPLDRDVEFDGCVGSRVVKNGLIKNSSRLNGSTGFRVVWRLVYDIHNGINDLSAYGLQSLEDKLLNDGYEQLIVVLHCCYNYHKAAKYHTFQSFVDAGGLIEGSGVKDSV